MTPLRLTTWFKKRMLAVVLAAAVPMAAIPPIGYHIGKRRELLASARGQAAQVAEVVRTAVEERPRLWRYDATKLGSRLAAEGLDHASLRVFAGGREVPIERIHPGPAPLRPLWGRYDLELPDPGDGAGVAAVTAKVWVAVDAADLWTRTAAIAAVFALLAAGLASVLYLLPVRAIGQAERRVHLLMGQLALTLQEEDRRRMARDLHDGAGQAITAARLELLAMAGQAATPETLRRIASHLDEALAEVRRSTNALAPPALAELGFARALERHCEAFADAAGLTVTCTIATDLPPLGGEVELACYRIVQEALTNTARHARAGAAWVTVEVSGNTLRVAVADDGAGLGAGQPADGGGRGLDNIRERARLLGGELALRPRGVGQTGLRLEATFPLPEVTA